MTTPTALVAAGSRRGKRRLPTRIIAFGLERADWERLEILAAAELRAPELQARWIVLQALRALPEEAAS